MLIKRLPAVLALLTILVCSTDTGRYARLSAANDDPQLEQQRSRNGEGRGRERRGRERGEAPEKVGLIRNDAEAYQGYTLLTPMMSRDTYLIDNEGRVVNKWETECSGLCAYLLKNGHLLRAGSSGFGGNATFHGGGAGGRIQEFTWDGELVWDFEYSSEDYLLHHDIEPMPNGNVLMVAWERKSADEAIDAGRDPAVQGDGDLWVDHVIEVKPTGKITVAVKKSVDKT